EQVVHRVRLRLLRDRGLQRQERGAGVRRQLRLGDQGVDGERIELLRSADVGERVRAGLLRAVVVARGEPRRREGEEAEEGDAGRAPDRGRERETRRTAPPGGCPSAEEDEERYPDGRERPRPVDGGLREDADGAAEGGGAGRLEPGSPDRGKEQEPER